MAKYTRSIGEKQIPFDCHFSLAEGGSVNINCPAISGRACMSMEHILTCISHDVPQQQMLHVGTRDKGYLISRAWSWSNIVMHVTGFCRKLLGCTVQ